jgi:hypothetical protein
MSKILLSFVILNTSTNVGATLDSFSLILSVAQRLLSINSLPIMADDNVLEIQQDLAADGGFECDSIKLTANLIDHLLVEDGVLLEVHGQDIAAVFQRDMFVGHFSSAPLFPDRAGRYIPDV